MILTARRVTATEGQALGFVNEVCKPGEVLATAKRIAGQILECSPMSIRASKETVYRGLAEQSLEAAIDAQRKYDAVRAMFTSEDLIEGPMAFAQKRPPQWKGR
jgi:crotonobetainyl-CoA hydratase